MFPYVCEPLGKLKLPRVEENLIIFFFRRKRNSCLIDTSVRINLANNERCPMFFM